MNIQESDKKIAAALRALKASPRGRQSLIDFQRLLLGAAGGLDSWGMAAMLSLLEEYGNGRRDFLKSIGPDPRDRNLVTDPAVFIAALASEGQSMSAEVEVRAESIDKALVQAQENARRHGVQVVSIREVS